LFSSGVGVQFAQTSSQWEASTSHWLTNKSKETWILYTPLTLLKGHGNEADFLGFLQKLVPHRSLTLPFKLF
jgi:hypothetical protein